MTDLTTLENLFRRLDSDLPAMIELQQALCAIPAIGPENGGTGEYDKAAFLDSVLVEMGFDPPLWIEAPDPRVPAQRRPSLMLKIPGADPDAPTVWVLTHTDIVPPGEMALWRRDPYEAYVMGDRIIGRGVEDNQQDLVASLFAAKACVDLVPLRSYGIGLAFVADEETTSSYGLSYILAHPDNPFQKTDLIIVPDSGNPEGTLIEIAEKSILWLKIRTLGKQCHGSRPAVGINAFTAASFLVTELHRDLHRRFDQQNDAFEPPISTFEPTRKDANVPNVNTIPGDDVFYMDCRVLPSYPLEEVMAEVRSIADRVEARFGVSISVEPVQQSQAPAGTPADAPVVGLLKAAIHDVYGVGAYAGGIGAGTVAACFRREGYPAAVWCRTDQSAHQPNEYCLLANMVGNAKVFAACFLAGAPPDEKGDHENRQRASRQNHHRKNDLSGQWPAQAPSG